MFASWERKGSLELSWETVIGVLESPIIGERRLAEDIKEKMAISTSSLSHTRADGSGEAVEAMASPLFVSGGIYIYISESERTLACAAIQSTFRMARN